MEKNQYKFEHLRISYNDKSRPYQIDRAEDVSFNELCKVIEEAVLGERLVHLQSFYDDEDYSIDIWAEGFRSCILVHDELHRISYNYISEKYANEEELVEIAGYYAPKKCICEDTSILLDIIITFLETGKPCEKYKWFKTEED